MASLRIDPRRAIKIAVLLALQLNFVGCSIFRGLQPMCESANESALGEKYASEGIDVRNFDIFSNQCAKYGYRVPSKEKFTASYWNRKNVNCSSPSKYFQASYRIYRLGGTPEDCPASARVGDFAISDVKSDAFNAYQVQKSIDEIDVRIKTANDNNGKKTYDSGFLLDALLRAAHEDNPIALQDKRSARVEQLKRIAKKYDLVASDL